MSRRDFDLIVAIDAKRGIGKNNDLPWRLPGDMAHFVAQTKSAPTGRRNAVIMGRVNWESIPAKYAPLAGRHNVVMTRTRDYFVPDGVGRADSLASAIADLPGDIDRVYVIGGGQIFAHAIEQPSCRRIYLTQIEADYDCDTFFPPFEGQFRRVNVYGRGEDSGVAYQIELWER